MTNSITPPPELVKQWLAEPEYVSGWNGKCTMISVTDHRLSNICAQAAQWGADQELEACCEWLCEDSMPKNSNRLRNARRPQPPSLKEQALSDLKNAYNADQICDTTYENIFRALEALPDD